ncbi:MAG: hypothetical protein WC004_03170 [Candidatus Absconditabacterales bacterium]
MKKTFFSFAAAICLAAICMGFYKAHLYTLAQVETAVSKATQYHLNWTTNPEPLQLGDLLYINVHVNIAEEEQAGSGTPATYKTGWRSLAAQNPWLLHEAIKSYGPLAVRMFQDSLIAWHRNALLPNASWRKSHLLSPERARERWLEKGWHWDEDPPTADSAYHLQIKRIQKWKADSISIEQNLASWSSKNYWTAQRQILRQYKKLAQALVALPDSTLQSYLNETSEKGRRASKTQTWLLSKGLIAALPEGDDVYRVWYLDIYPMDLLLLTRRISKDYSSITGPKRFLKQVILACDELNAIIPK